MAGETLGSCTFFDELAFYLVGKTKGGSRFTTPAVHGLLVPLDKRTCSKLKVSIRKFRQLGQVTTEAPSLGRLELRSVRPCQPLPFAHSSLLSSFSLCSQV